MTILQIEIEDSRPVEAHCENEHLIVTLADGRRLQTPLWWYPRLLNAAETARDIVEFSPLGIHWPELDEDLSIAGMLRGAKAPGAKAPGSSA